MARLKDREKALFLRKQGKSYSQIKKFLDVSKSTLSYWLRNYPLSKQRIKELRDCNEQRIERFRETMKRKRDLRLQQFYKEQKQLLLPLNKREMFLAGIFLYWGEGKKTSFTELSLSNTDPSIINFFITWIVKSLGVSKDKLKIQLHLYKNMVIKKEINFWSNILNLPKNQFNKPYIKESSTLRINHKGGFGHGTCNVRIGGVRLTEKIFMAIKVIADRYHKTRV